MHKIEKRSKDKKAGHKRDVLIRLKAVDILESLEEKLQTIFF